MLFSRQDVADFVTRNFEPVWEMVRPVPIVRIDFGNGTVATRTLHGNVASYVCAADGQVMDILPGIYTPAVYLSALEAPRLLAGAASRTDADRRLALIRNYHQERARGLRIQAARAANVQPVGNRPADLGKKVMERPVENHVQLAQLAQAYANRNAANAPAAPMPRTAAELANWQPLVIDTRRNETERRLLIHDRLAGADAVQPEQIKRWLYRDVLQADIDDPTMGLGRDVFEDLER